MDVRLVQTAQSRYGPIPASGLVMAHLVEGIPQVLGCLKRADGRYAWANVGFADRLGCRPQDVVGRTVEELFPPDFAVSYADQDALVLATGQPLQGHLELIVRADGRIGWYVTSKTRVLDESGGVWGVAVLSVDLNAHLTSGHAGLATAIDRVRADVSHPWRVPELAAIAGLSPKQLERLARRTLGTSPQRLVQRLRVERAVREIVTTDASLGTIAAECGFYDQSSFTRQFRRVLGVTPGAYRRVRR